MHALDIIRVFLHVLAATVWVGGQLTLVFLLPVLRRHEGAPREAARRFNVVAWTAFAVLLVTGVWNLLAVGGFDVAEGYRRILEIKIAVVLLSGVAALLHMYVSSRRGKAIWGALSGLSAIGALLLGVML
ncbi:hypothetical protein [Allonocardiopsis opalescens]|uniref:Copper resistance protein D n=1 Tax=Allonocardiopsis opalescens TaxID=1144618 RepID=A0A2T0PW22_9ACTN|nr:hypothetical protein [Allonocardiopsis opalescens]PRX95736.1 hypothetical protein CLV72_109349 [Allonocardiopsis opalescens]